MGIDLWPHQRCVSASLPNPLNLASDSMHAEQQQSYAGVPGP